MPITIDDISRQLGLSVSTVSKALNDYEDVSPRTKERVRVAAAALGYHPSAAARNLRRQRTEKLGFSYGFPTTYIGEFASRLINGAVAAAEQEGYNLTLYPLSGQQLHQLVRIARSREVDGILLMGGSEWEEAVDLLRQEGMPFVLLNRRSEDPAISFVTSDHLAAGDLVTQHLLDRGHRRIGFVTRPELSTGIDRIAGYRQALERAGLPFDPALVTGAPITPGAAHTAAAQLLALPDPPTALIGLTDPVAIACLQAAQAAGRRVPEDVAVAGSDDIREALAAIPPLTTLHPPLAEIGRLATAALLAQVNHPEQPPVRLQLPVTLVVRQST